MAAPSLSSYRAKRDFARTSEPAGGAPAGGGRRFVVHKHNATADHYDLRLEHDGVLKSWAVPKGPSLDPAEKRLAVQTEDHPVEYVDYEGVIPQGEYGGGPMIVWDTGTWAPMGDADAHLAKGDLKFRLSGQKLRGGWMLVRLKPRKGEKRTSWLLFKERDDAAAPGSDILAERPESVKSGRRIEELLAPPARPTTRLRPPAPLRPSALPGAAKAPMPARIPAQLASPAAEAPSGEGWLHEIKLDGYRTLARRDADDVRLITRAGLDWTHRYGDLGDAVRALPCRAALVDGEIVVPDAQGISRFALLQEALSAGARNRLVFFAFDLLHLDGWDLTAAPLARRKALLASLLAGQAANAAIQFSDHVAGNGAAFFETVADRGLEGTVSKRSDAPYTPGRSRSWVKAKAPLTGEFAIVGFTRSAANGGIGALALGERVGDDLVYRGKVGSGFDAATVAELAVRLEAMTGAEPVPGAPKDVVPVRPTLTARIRFSNLTADGAVRHAVFRGLREVTPMPTDTPTEATTRKRLITDDDLANLWVTNPDRRLFGRNGPTKLDLAVYYAHVGDVMLPHILGRPVSLFRCPTGLAKDCFFQRHPFTGMPEGLARFEVEKADGEDRTYIAVETPQAYLSLAQFGVVELHAWGCRRDRIEKPDRVIFDLDPGEGVAWREVVEAALHVRDVLAGKGLVPFAKTTGGKGIHVVVPVTRRLAWPAVHAATGALSADIAATAPDTFTTTMGPANRKRRIFIDWHRNARSATAVAPYSLRARNNLPASAPLTWESLAAVDAPEDLNYATLPGLVAATGDPWAGIAEAARNLPAAPRVKG